MLKLSRRGLVLDWKKEPAASSEIAVFEPESVLVPLCRSRREAMGLAVRPGSSVQRFKPLAVPDGDGCAVYSPFDGEFQSIEKVKLPGVGNVPCALVKRNEKYVPKPETYNIDTYTPDELIELSKKFAIVDELDGGYLHQKLQAAKELGIKAVIADAADDQPYMAAGAGLLFYRGEQVAKGLKLAAKAAEAAKTAIAVFQSSDLNARFESKYDGVETVAFQARYPLYAKIEKHLEKMGGGIRIGAGAALALYRAAVSRVPQHTQIVTVAGEDKSMNVEVPHGARIRELLAFCGIRASGLLVANGALNGTEIDLDAVVYAGLRSLTVLLPPVSSKIVSCIGCGSCNDVCPEGILPSYILRALEQNDLPSAGNFGLDECSGCGCCSYVCPAGLPLSANMEIAKHMKNPEEAVDEK